VNSRERLETALKFKEPDRVPIDLGSIVTGITTAANDALKKYLGFESDDPVVDRIQQLALPSDALLERLRVDTRYIYLSASRDWHDIELPDNTYQDEFGVKRTAAFDPETGRLLYYDFVVGTAPLAHIETAEEMAKIDWPDPHDAARYAGLEEQARDLYENTNYAIIINAIGSIFEFSWYLRGFEQFYTDIALNPDIVEALLDGMLEYQTAMFGEILDRAGPYVSVVMAGADLGTQRGPVISEEVYKRIVWPRQKKFYDFIHSKTGAPIFYHSCGSIVPMIPHLIDARINALHPVQPMAAGMGGGEGEREWLKREYGNKISFWGGLDQQGVLPFGTPQEVRDATKRLLDAFMPGGGCVFCTGHNIQKGVPPENVLVAYDTAYEYGRY
jgi:uroporphyrinogen decarboxylase